MWRFRGGVVLRGRGYAHAMAVVTGEGARASKDEKCGTLTCNRGERRTWHGMVWGRGKRSEACVLLLAFLSFACGSLSLSRACSSSSSPFLFVFTNACSGFSPAQTLCFPLSWMDECIWMDEWWMDGDKLLAMDEYAGFVSLTWLDGQMFINASDGQTMLFGVVY